MKIAADTEVEFRYRLFDADGQMVEETEPDEPVRYRHGRQEILPGLEDALEGAEVGASLRVDLEAEAAYGPYDPEGIVAIPRAEFDADVEISPGQVIEVHVQDEDGGEEEGEMQLRVIEVHPEQVLADANHPLAGQRVTFEVEVLSVEASA